MSKIVYIVTHEMTARLLLRGQLAFMRKKGWNVSLVCSPGEELSQVTEEDGAEVLTVPLEREIHPVKDLISLFRLFRLLMRIRPDVVHASTPKAGLLGMLASFAARVPLRFYMARGLRMETAKGLSRGIMRCTERIACFCSHRVICVSKSLREKYIQFQLAPESKLVVLGRGSSNGFDISRFHERNKDENARLRRDLGIPKDALVIGFVGRFTRDKGIRELLDTFELLLKSFPNLYLLAVGDFEKGDPVDKEYEKKFRTQNRIVLPGFVADTAPYYQIMNVLVFPSYREGFPNAPLEAGASGVPTVGFKVTGTVDAISDGRTGTLVPLSDTAALAEAIRSYLLDEQMRRDRGNAAREWALQFTQETVWENFYREVERLLDTGM